VNTGPGQLHRRSEYPAGSGQAVPMPLDDLPPASHRLPARRFLRVAEGAFPLTGVQVIQKVTDIYAQ
jgi:hypothetical protein